MKPNTELTKHTFIDGDFSMDINVSEEERTIYMSQNKVAILLGISGGTVSKYIKKLANSKWDSVSKNEQNDKKVFPSVSTELDLEIIKEIGKRYNPERIEKLENWLYDILPTTDYEIVDNNYEIVRYNQDNLDIPVRFENDGETLWMTAKEMAILFDTTEKNIYYHMENIFEDKELSDYSIFKESLTMGQTGQKYKVALYNLDMILAVGYRIRSEKAVHFRRWANEVIKEHLRFSYFGKGEAYLPVINQEINNRLDVLEQRIEKLEPKEHIFFRNISFDAYIFLVLQFSTARKEIFIIDVYADEHLLSALKAVQEGVKVIIVVGNKSHISKEEVEIFHRNHPNVDIELIDAKDEHDRHIFIDRKTGFLLGSSINTIGYYDFHITEITNSEYINQKIEKYKP